MASVAMTWRRPLLLALLGVTALVFALWGALEYRRAQTAFILETERLQTEIGRRLEKTDMLLRALEAQAASERDFQPEAWRRVAQRLLGQERFLYSAEVFRLIGERERFRLEARWRATLGRPLVRDFNVDGRRVWHPAPARPSYLIATLIEPDHPGVQPVYGFDILHNQDLGPAAQLALSTGGTVTSPPFHVLSGRKVYFMMRPFYLGDDQAPARPWGLVAVLVDGQQLLQSVALHPDIALAMATPTTHTEPLFAVGPTTQNAGTLWTLQRTVWLPTDSQRLQLTFRQFVPWKTLEYGRLVLGLLFGWLLTLALWRAQRALASLRAARQRADARLFDREEEAAVTLSAIHDGVLTLDAAQRIVLANPMALALLERPQTEVIGQPVGTVMVLRYELAEGLAEDPVASCFRLQVPVELPENCVLQLPNGRTRMVEGAVAPCRAQDGHLTGAVFAFRDIGPATLRARERLEASENRVKGHLERLVHTDRLHILGEMATGLAHEINQPLTAITNYCQASIELLEEGEPSLVPEVRAALHQAVRQADRAGDIIRRLRAFVSNQEVDVRPLDLNQVVANAVFLDAYDLKAAGVEVVQWLSGQPVPVMADSIQLEQVVLNLLSNATAVLQSRPVGERHIVLTTLAEDGWGRLEVRDNGPGLGPEAQARLFQPFYSTKPQGLGLGLPICQTIVERYGGCIEVESPASGGAVFRVCLPLAAEPPTTALPVGRLPR